MKLTLLRHAKSSWGDDTLSDFERPLNKRGQRDTPQMAARFKSRDNLPEKILCSPALRTTQTSELFIAALQLDNNIRVFVDDIYEAQPGTLVDAIATHGESVEQLLLIGHNPGIEYLCAMFNGGERVSMPTCAVCEFEILGIDSWREIANAQARLSWYDYPKSQ